MSDDGSRSGRTADENSQPKEHPVPPAFNPIPASHSTPNNHVHSVVPDLMRVYESLTKGNPETRGGHGVQQPSQNEQHEPTHSHQQQHQQQVQVQGQVHQQSQPQQHVNYAYITSEEQYRQLYQHQSSGSQDPNQLQHYQAQMPSSLPYIPAPYDGGNGTPGTPPPAQGVTQEAAAGPDKPSRGEDSNSKPAARSTLKRRRSSSSQQQPESTTNTASKPKGRKKAKDTDGRWSKRFTWPEELHRDFVSAVFDVGLKHSSPSTILEHMPKHPQITSERIKSHLQKYRVHRIKSKQDFMSSYESSLEKFKSGELDKAKSLTDGEVSAHLTHAVMTGTSDSSGSAYSTCRGAKNTVALQQQLHAAPPPATNAAAALSPQHGVALPAPSHEALMLPKLTEAEKASPIGASMGYLLGLFFSLKKQLLVQRAAHQSRGLRAAPSSAVMSIPATPVTSPPVTNGPVTAVYNSFVESPAPTTSATPAATPMHIPSPMAPPAILPASSMDWSSSNAPLPTGAADRGAADRGAADRSAAPAAPASVPNPVLNAGSTRNNLEASSMMKREMQNQMAFQNKMRALKQQELNKYKNVAPNQHLGSGISQQNEQATTTVRFKEPADALCYTEASGSSYHHAVSPSAQGAPASTTSTTSENALAVATFHHETAQGSHFGGNRESAKSPPPGSGGNTNVQGAGEEARPGEEARARASSFSIGGNDDFWNADVMDEQLFEFLMNN